MIVIKEEFLFFVKIEIKNHDNNNSRVASDKFVYDNQCDVLQIPANIRFPLRCVKRQQKVAVMLFRKLLESLNAIRRRMRICFAFRQHDLLLTGDTVEQRGRNDDKPCGIF